MMDEPEEKEESEEESKDSGGGSKKLIIIIVIVLVVLIGGGVGAFFALGYGGDAADYEAGDVEEEFVDENSDLPGAIFPLDVFIVNLSVKGSFLKTNVQLEFLEPTLPPTLENDIPRVRDAVIRVMTSKTATELLSVEGKEILREEIREIINETLGGDEIGNVYFTEFIIQ